MRVISRTTAAILSVALAAMASGAVHAATTPDEDDDSADLTEIELPESMRILSLSPDGQLIAAWSFPSERISVPQPLCVYDVETMEERSCADLRLQLQRGIAFDADSVAWSPDSTMLAFAEDAFRMGLDSDLWVMDAATGELTNLTDDRFEGRLPILANDDEQPDDPVYIDVLPTWAPDGRSLAISRSPIVDGEILGTELVSVDVATGATELLTTVTTDALGAVYQGMAWAPDGRRLYYSVALPESSAPENGVWEYYRETGESQQVVASDPDKGPPTLVEVAATGTTGLVVYLRLLQTAFGTDDHLALLDLETHALSGVHPVADSPPPATVALATFSPDGTRLLFSMLHGDVDRYFVQTLPDGEPDEVATGLDTRPMMTTLGGGIYWADDGTVLIVTGIDSGVVLHLDPGAVPAITVDDDTTPGTAPPDSLDVESFQPDTVVALIGEATMRATASSQGVAVLELRPGAALLVLAEPVETSDGPWVPVLERATGTIGYVEASLFEPSEE